VRWLRSLLFVPGSKPDWIEKAWRSNPDGVIIDLEDAVPYAEKEKVRLSVRQVLEQADPEKYHCVRVNSIGSKMAFDDLEAVVHSNLNAVMLPKVATAAEIAEVDARLAVLEQNAGIARGSIGLPLLLETALGMRHAYDIAVSNSRVDAILMSAGPGGDAQRAIGYRWSKTGTETLFLRSKIVLDARAAGVSPLINSWYDIKDTDGLRSDAQLNRSLGYMGMAVIHPAHVNVVNEVFTPSAAEIRFYRGLLQAFEEAVKIGNAAAVYEGDMVDYAMAATARQYIEVAKRFGVK
jgi:citrate lyase subunit beta / citryl-CoA lyase